MNKLMARYIAIIFILFVLLTGCQFQQDGKEELNTIGRAELSDETRRIMSALGMSEYHVFDLTRKDPASSKISVWIEIFEHGVRQDKLLNIISGGYAALEERINKSQVIFSYKFKDNEETGDRTLSLGVSILENNGSSRAEHDIVLPPNLGGHVMSPLSTKREIQINQPVGAKYNRG